LRSSVILALSACGLLASCESKPAEKVESARPVATVIAAFTQDAPAAHYAGTVRSRLETRLAFRASGQVQSRAVDMGAQVARGQVLMQLDPKDAELSTTSASGHLRAAELSASAEGKDLERAGVLLAEGFISKSEYDRQKASNAQAQAQLISARSQFGSASRQAGFTTLIAPRAGVIGGVQAEAGDVVAAGQTVMTLSDPSAPEVAISVPEDQAEALRKSPEIWVTLWANPGVRLRGRLRSLASVADATTRTFDARIAIEKPFDGVKLGQTSEVLVSRRAPQPGASIPLTALDERGGGVHVWLVDRATQTLRSRPVVVGGVDRENALIVAGLRPGDVVVVSGVQVLRQGERVKAGPVGPSAPR